MEFLCFANSHHQRLSPGPQILTYETGKPDQTSKKNSSIQQNRIAPGSLPLSPPIADLLVHVRGIADFFVARLLVVTPFAAFFWQSVHFAHRVLAPLVKNSDLRDIFNLIITSLLRYQSSTLTLYKELSSPIFQSQSVRHR